MTASTEHGRAEFEYWYSSEGKQPEVLTKVGESTIYKDPYTGVAWQAWKSARRAPAAPVQMPEPGINTANHAGIRVIGYTEQQVRELLAAAKVERDPLTDSEIESATGAKQGTPLFLAAKGFAIAIERAHGIGKDKA